MKNIIEILSDNNRLDVVIHAKNTLTCKILLLTILVPLLLIPLWGFILMIAYSYFSFPAIVGLALFCLIFVYPFLKITMWQLYGKESISISRNAVHYEAYFKFLYTKKSDYSFDNLQIVIGETEEDKKLKSVQIKFTDPLKKEDHNNTLSSALMITENEFDKIKIAFEKLSQL